MPRQATTPTNDRGLKIAAILKEQGLGITEAAKKARKPFNVLYSLIHIPTYRPKPDSVATFEKRLGIPRAVTLLGVVPEEPATKAPRAKRRAAS